MSMQAHYIQGKRTFAHVEIFLNLKFLEQEDLSIQLSRFQLEIR